MKIPLILCPFREMGVPRVVRSWLVAANPSDGNYFFMCKRPNENRPKFPFEFPFYRESNCKDFSFRFSKFIEVPKKFVLKKLLHFVFPLAKQDILNFRGVLSELPIFKNRLELQETFPYRIPILSRIKLQ